MRQNLLWKNNGSPEIIISSAESTKSIKDSLPGKAMVSSVKLWQPDLRKNALFAFWGTTRAPLPVSYRSQQFHFCLNGLNKTPSVPQGIFWAPSMCDWHKEDWVMTDLKNIVRHGRATRNFSK